MSVDEAQDQSLTDLCRPICRECQVYKYRPPLFQLSFRLPQVSFSGRTRRNMYSDGSCRSRDGICW